MLPPASNSSATTACDIAIEGPSRTTAAATCSTLKHSDPRLLCLTSARACPGGVPLSAGQQHALGGDRREQAHRRRQLAAAGRRRGPDVTLQRVAVVRPFVPPMSTVSSSPVARHPAFPAPALSMHTKWRAAAQMVCAVPADGGAGMGTVLCWFSTMQLSSSTCQAERHSGTSTLKPAKYNCPDRGGKLCAGRSPWAM